MPYKYIGKTTHFRGKTLWEILGNLKDYGVGRIVTRSRFERYPEPCYYKILKVETLPEPKNPSLDDMRKVRVHVERIFRGRLEETYKVIQTSSYKPDFRLIPKDEEEEYCKLKQPITNKERILPRTTDFPPLLRELIIRESQSNGENSEEPKLEIVYNPTSLANMYRIAKEGETPTVEVPSGLGTPASPSLYENLKL